MLEIIKFEKKHIPEVKQLFAQYLVPNYLRRIGISKDDITDEIKEFEWILDPDAAFEEFYQQCSVVCLDKAIGKVVACCMGYCLNEQSYQEMYIENAKKYLQLKNQPKGMRRYARSLIHNYDCVNIFQKYNLENIYYPETSIVLPEYQGHGLTDKMIIRGLELAGDDVKAILAESQIPPEVWQGRENEFFKKTSSEEVILSTIVDNGFLCVLVIIFGKPSLTSKL